MKKILGMILLINVLIGCSGNKYVEPTGPESATLSIKNTYAGEVSGFITLHPFISVFGDSQNCLMPQTATNKQELGFRIPAGVLFTARAGLILGYPSINRAKPEDAIFSFVPELGANYELLIDHDRDTASVSLQLINASANKVEPIVQRHYVLEEGESKGFVQTCNDKYVADNKEEKIYGRHTISNLNNIYKFTGGGDNTAIITTGIKLFENISNGFSQDNLSIYTESPICSSRKKLSSNLEYVEEEVPADKEVAFFYGVDRAGVRCSVFFAFTPEKGQRYEIKSFVDPILYRSCSVSVVDVSTGVKAKIHKKKLDRKLDPAQCVDVVQDADDNKFRDTITSKFKL